jgi:hypothetical protein
VIVDPDLPAAEHMLGPGADHLVAAGLRELGGRLVNLAPTQVVYRPGSELTVRYDARVVWGEGDEVDEVLCTGTTRDGAPAGTVPLVADGLEAGLWRYPFDPALPGLEPSVMAAGVAAVAGAFVGPNPSLKVMAYRPGRRAVIHAVGEGTEVYLKVVRPSTFDSMVAIHHTLARHLPVPEVLAGDPETGILVLRALSGRPLRDRLREGDGEGGRSWPPAEAIIELLDRLAAVPVPRSAKAPTPISDGPRPHLTMIERVLPEESARLDRLRRALVDERATPSVGAHVLIHGDLHEAQLMVEGSTITGMLDIDGVGPGERVDDLARLLGHLSTLALGAKETRVDLEAYVGRLRASFAQVVDPHELDLRAGAVAVGLATGPFRVQAEGWEAETRRRLDLALRWCGIGSEPG